MTLRRLPIALLLLAVVVITACRSVEFRISFALEPEVSDNYVLLYYASDPEGGVLREQVAVVNAGKGEVVGKTVNPCLVYAMGGSGTPEAIFYAERGDRIEISGGKSPYSWKISGNAISESLSAWRLENRKVLESHDAKKINAAVLKFVKGHEEDPVSTLLLLVYSDRGEDPAGFDKAWKSLKGKAAEEKWSQLVGRNDMLTGYAAAPAPVKSFTVKDISGKKDTVTPKRGSVLLYFYKNGSEGRNDAVEAIKKRVKARRDSARGVIVMISCEADSTSWKYQTRRDSVRGVVNAWLPLGLADSLTKRLGVTSLPSAIIIDSLGRIRKTELKKTD